MELSQNQRNTMLVAGLILCGAFVVARAIQPKEVPQILKPTIMATPAQTTSDTDDFAQQQSKEWEAIFDPRSPDSQKAQVMIAERRFQDEPNPENASAVKQLLMEFYDQYKSSAQYERALAVLHRILQLDGNIGKEDYWQDKNELALAYLRAGQDVSATAVINELFENVPSKTSAQQHLKGVLGYYLQADKPNEAMALVYRMVRYDKQHDWPLFLGYKSFIRLAEEFEEQDLPTKAQEVYDLGLNVEVHRNQPWGQAQIMQRYAGFQERRGMKEQADALRRNAQLIEARVNQDARYSESAE